MEKVKKKVVKKTPQKHTYKKKPNGKNATGRPTKLTKKVLKILNKLLDTDNKDSIKAIILTDDDLLFLLNEKLTDGEKIGGTAWKNWKSKGFGKKREGKTLEEMDEIGQQFVSVYKKAIVTQRNYLFDNLSTSTTWQRWAWIIERKYDSWNIRHKTEHSGEIAVNQEGERRAKELVDEARKA